MQGGIRSIFSHGSILKNAVLQHVRVVNPVACPLILARYESTSAAKLEEHGFESTTISDILKAKGKSADGSWLWCTTDDSVYDAVKSMTTHNVGALVVVKPEQEKALAGIITERDYLRKIIVQGRSSKSTKVGDDSVGNSVYVDLMFLKAVYSLLVFSTPVKLGWLMHSSQSCECVAFPTLHLDRCLTLMSYFYNPLLNLYLVLSVEMNYASWLSKSVVASLACFHSYCLLSSLRLS